MALALAPSGADAPAAVFLLGEAREGVAATLGRGVWTGVTGCPALTWPPSSGPFPPPPTQPAGHPPVLSKPGGLEQGGPERHLWVHSLVAWAACPGSNGPGASGWVAGDARAWGAAAGAGRGPGPRRWALQCGALGLRPRPGGGRARSPRGAGPALGGGARRLQGCPAAPDGRWWRGAPPGLAPPGSCPPRPVPAHLGLPGSARCLVPSAEICPGPRGTRKVACWAGGPSPGPGGSAITWTAYMACLLATDSPSGARGGSAPVDRAPARPSPGPEPPAPPPAPPAGTWQKRPVKSGGHRHWFREEHWPPFIQGRGHTTGEERWVRAQADPCGQRPDPVPHPHPVSSFPSSLLPSHPLVLSSLGSWP